MTLLSQTIDKESSLIKYFSQVSFQYAELPVDTQITSCGANFLVSLKPQL